jgi:hypothetical protein
MGRTFVVEWSQIMLVAAGSVQITEFVRRPARRLQDHRLAGPLAVESGEVERYDSREALRAHLLLELILTRAVLRFSITADRFNFAYLQGRRTGSVSQDFALLVQDVIGFAPSAIQNRGAQALCGGPPERISYPSKNAFSEEMIWLLWQAQAGPLAPPATGPAT